jgi:hypothetical protein
MQILDQLISCIESGINLLTLGSYYDLSQLLSPSGSDVAATIFAVILTVLKWSMLVIAIFLFWKFICDKIRLTTLVVLILTACSLVPILLFYNNPINDVNTIQTRVSGFIQSFNSSSYNYTPSIIEPVVSTIEIPVNMTGNVLRFASNATPDNITVPALQSGDRLPTITTTSVNISWVGWLIYIVVIVLSIYILSRLSKILAVVVAFIIFGLAISLPNVMVASIILIVVFSALIYVLSSRIPIFALYPASAILLVLAYILQPTQNVLIIMLIACFIMCLLPVFYIFGYTVHVAGKFIEERGKLGMKKHPKKYIEEVAGEWDVNAIAVILTIIFVAVVILFGISTSGMGTFLALTFGLLKKSASPV